MLFIFRYLVATVLLLSVVGSFAQSTVNGVIERILPGSLQLISGDKFVKMEDAGVILAGGGG